MDKNKQYKIALVLFTSGIDYDDRIRKEILSIQEIFTNISFKIFAVENQHNREEEGVTSYGVPYRIPYLKTRDKYAAGSHTLAKAWDFYATIKEDLKPFDAIWCADVQSFVVLLFSNNKPLLWDLHELPLEFMHNPALKILFKYLEKKVNVMVHANNARLNYLESIGFAKHPEKHYSLRNYPQFNEIDNEYDDAYNRFVKWKGDSRCVYLQGLTNANRAASESIKAVLSFPELKAVVVGGFEDSIKEELQQEFGLKYLDSRIYFTGRLKQIKTPQYIRQCFMSLVFYKNTSANNWYCEPNRLFQNIINGNPVVVGNNPPMKEFVKDNNFGVFVNTDGNDVDGIIGGIKELLNDYDKYKENVDAAGESMLWNSQNGVIKDIMEKFLSRI